MCCRFLKAALWNPPGTVPQVFSFVRAVLVRAEIIQHSSSVTIAMILTVGRLAFGMSAPGISRRPFPARPRSGRLG